MCGICCKQWVISGVIMAQLLLLIPCLVIEIKVGLNLVECLPPFSPKSLLFICLHSVQNLFCSFATIESKSFSVHLPPFSPKSLLFVCHHSVQNLFCLFATIQSRISSVCLPPFSPKSLLFLMSLSIKFNVLLGLIFKF